jgi:chromatin assembly factor 1 subunit B
LPYRYVFAIATEDSIFFYDTQSIIPFAYVTGIHYSNLSDLSWSPDGRLLIATSIDGFSTFVVFNPNELGIIYEPPSITSSQTSQQPVGSQNQILIKAN